MVTVDYDPHADFYPANGSRFTPTRLLIVDDQAAVRAGLRELLGDQADFDVVVVAVGSAERGADDLRG